MDIAVCPTCKVVAEHEKWFCIECGYANRWYLPIPNYQIAQGVIQAIVKHDEKVQLQPSIESASIRSQDPINVVEVRAGNIPITLRIYKGMCSANDLVRGLTNTNNPGGIVKSVLLPNKETAPYLVNLDDNLDEPALQRERLGWLIGGGEKGAATVARSLMTAGVIQDMGMFDAVVHQIYGSKSDNDKTGDQLSDLENRLQQRLDEQRKEYTQDLKDMCHAVRSLITEERGILVGYIYARLEQMKEQLAGAGLALPEPAYTNQVSLLAKMNSPKTQ
jgi:hypothetical protein